MGIVLSRSIGLAVPAATGINANNPLIGWRNVVTTGAITADGETSADPATNLANASTANKWTGASAVAQTLVVDVPAGEAVDYVGIARHNFGSKGITVSLDTRPSTADDWTEAVPEFLPADDAPILMRFAEHEPAQVRVNLGAGDAAPSAAVLHVGKLLVLQRRLYVGHEPAGMARRENVVTATSQGGQFLGAVVTGETLQSSIDLANLTPGWVRGNLDPFLAAGSSVAFFWAWRPSTYPGEVVYAWRTGAHRLVNQRSNGMMQFSMPIGATRS